MYERMLDKQHQPTMDQFLEHCGKAREMFQVLDEYLTDDLKAEKMLRFPYGNSYGWGMKYAIKSKHICDVFAEKDAFTVMLRLSNKQFETCYDQLADDTKECIDHKYPCGDGGWIHDRVLTEQHLIDIKKLLQLKAQR